MIHALIAGTLLAARAEGAGNLTNLHSLTGETKIKGGWTAVGGHLCFTREKGGSNSSGSLGRFDPSNGAMSDLAHAGLLAKGKLVKITHSDQTHWTLLSRDVASVTDGPVKLAGPWSWRNAGTMAGRKSLCLRQARPSAGN